MNDVEAAWAEVTASWADEAAHRRFLDGLPDLDGLAEAGRRYKAVLAERPDDPVAARWREEVLRRATAVALASLPRTRPPRQLPPGLRRTLFVALAVGSLAATAWVLVRMMAHTRGP